MGIADFEKIGLNYLYNLDPATGNLFYLKSLEIMNKDGSWVENSKLASVLRFRVKSVKLDNTLGIEFDTSKAILPGNPILINGIKESHNATIEWVEDSFFRVQKLHQEWLSKWINQKTLVDGREGKFFKFTFLVFKLYNTSEDFSPNLSTETAYTLVLEGAAPTDLSEFSFSYDEQDNGKSFIGKYVVKEIKIYSSEDPADITIDSPDDDNLKFELNQEEGEGD